MRHWQGREDELAQLEAWLYDPAVQLVGVKAAGGFGKSALVRKLIAQAEGAKQAEPFEQIMAVTFSQAYAFSLWGRWLMAHFGERVEDATSDRALAQMVANTLRTRRCLLVLDNLETLLLAKGRRWKDEGYQQFLQAWLADSGRSVVVVTSREEPDVANNLVRYCKWCDLQGLAAAAGVALLSELGVIGEAAQMHEFVRAASGHPLLLKLAAGWLQVEEAEDMRLAYLEEGELDVMAIVGAHRGQPEVSVEEILAATLARLSEPMQKLLPALSLYRLSFDLKAAQAMGGDAVSESDLQSLTKRCLLQSKKQSVNGQRVRLFEFQPLVQRFLRTRASRAEYFEVAHKGAVSYYQSRKSALGRDADLADTVPYQEVFYHLCELGQYAAALSSIKALTDEDDRYSSCDMTLQLRGHNAVRLTLYEQLLQQWQPRDNEERRMRADALQAQGDVLQFLNRREEALANYASALEIYRAVGARLGEANTLQAQGRMQEDHKQGIDYLLSAHTLYEQIGDLYSQGVNLYYLGGLYIQAEQIGEAVDALERAAALGEAINFPPLIEAAQAILNQLRSNSE